MCLQPQQIDFQLPDWMPGFLQGQDLLPDPESRMALVIEASRQNVIQGTGGPFAAAVFEQESGRLVSLGVNLVVGSGLSMLHAEMVAFSLAQRKLGSYDLGAHGQPIHELVSSAEPCAMCLGGLFWSGVRHLVFGARDADVRTLGFDEGPKPDDLEQSLARRGISLARDVLRESAVAVLRDYAERAGTIYNARAGIPPAAEL